MPNMGEEKGNGSGHWKGFGEVLDGQLAAFAFALLGAALFRGFALHKGGLCEAGPRWPSGSSV